MSCWGRSGEGKGRTESADGVKTSAGEDGRVEKEHGREGDALDGSELRARIMISFHRGARRGNDARLPSKRRAQGFQEPYCRHPSWIRCSRPNRLP